MHTGEWSQVAVPDRLETAAEGREFALAGRDVDPKRRAQALSRIVRAVALTPVPARYFEPDRIPRADAACAEQFRGA